VIKRHGRARRVFGYWRGAPGPTPARIQFRRKGAKRWRTVKRVETNRAGYLVSKVDVGAAGTFRLVFD
jgi:5-hydroxyisourate hydrolase-like protein (transthyretin family)